MSQSPLSARTETIAEIVQLQSGALIIRARAGRKLKLTHFAKTASRSDGTFLLVPVEQQIEMNQAMEILGIPYTTLRRLIQQGVIVAFKRSPCRWVLDLSSVLEHKEKSVNNPEYWGNLKAAEMAPEEVNQSLPQPC